MQRRRSCTRVGLIPEAPHYTPPLISAVYRIKAIGCSVGKLYACVISVHLSAPQTL